MSQENVDSVRRAFDAINRRDFDAVLEEADPEVEIVLDWSRANGPERDIFRGSDRVRQFLGSWWEAFEESAFVLDEIVDAAPDQVISVFHLRVRGRQSGVDLGGPGAVFVWRFSDSGLVSTTLYQERAEALEAVGLTE